MYAITRRIDGSSWAIVGSQGRMDFPLEDGPIIADLLHSEFPQCQGCEDREDVCERCLTCPDCGGCPACVDMDDDPEGEATEDGSAR